MRSPCVYISPNNTNKHALKHPKHFPQWPAHLQDEAAVHNADQFYKNRGGVGKYVKERLASAQLALGAVRGCAR